MSMHSGIHPARGAGTRMGCKGSSSCRDIHLSTPNLMTVHSPYYPENTITSACKHIWAHLVRWQQAAKSLLHQQGETFTKRDARHQREDRFRVCAINTVVVDRVLSNYRCFKLDHRLFSRVDQKLLLILKQQIMLNKVSHLRSVYR